MLRDYNIRAPDFILRKREDHNLVVTSNTAIRLEANGHSTYMPQV